MEEEGGDGGRRRRRVMGGGQCCYHPLELHEEYNRNNAQVRGGQVSLTEPL